MDEAQLLRILNRLNVWWDGQPVPSSIMMADHKRRDFYTFRNQMMDQRRIAALLGPRQVGKTTLCGQLIDSLLTPPFEVDPDKILYLTIDNSQILSDPANIVQDSIDVYERHILQEALQSVQDTIYVFIDEIQKSGEWADTLKYYTDTYDNLQFVIAGSVSTLIQQDASETLVGRIYRQILMPMKFIEYIRYFDSLDEDRILETSTDLRTALKQSAISGDQTKISAELTGFYGKNQKLEPNFISIKDQYVLKGGYPGVLDDSIADSYAKIDTDLQYTVTGDLANVFNVNKPEKVLQVLRLLAESTGNKLNIQNIADTANIDRDTVERYLEHLQEFFLVSPSHRFRTSEYKSGGKDKMYLQDVGVYNTLSGTLAEESLNDSNAMGPIIETAVIDHCRRLQFNFSDHQNADIWYWDKVGEVDCILRGRDYVLPIEIKHGDSTNYDLRGLRRFIEESNAEFGLAVNNGGAFVQDGDVLHVPVWLFLYLC